MALILNIETATTNCSVSLSKDGETLVLREDNSAGYSHAETLHVYIDQLFKETNLSPKDLDAIAVSKGPGSYTGLRIGVSSAKGMCFALDKPLIAIDTLKSLAQRVKAESGLVVSMLDARRMEVYSAIYTSDYKLHRAIKAEVLTDDSYNDIFVDNKVYFVGNGVEKTKTLIQHPNAIFVEGHLPSANEMASLSESKYKKSDIEDVAYFEPYYLKDFVAVKKKN